MRRRRPFHAPPPNRLAVGLFATIFATAAGCTKTLATPESALAPAGPQAGRVAWLIWLFVTICVVVYALVVLALAWAFVRRRSASQSSDADTPLPPEPPGDRRVWAVVLSATGLTVITLFVLLIADFATGRALHRLADSPETIRVQVIGHQWWWDVEYVDWPQRFGERIPMNRVSGANEIHVSVDAARPVVINLELDSRDVIHSFWVPSLSGKNDAIPGHPTSLYIRADKPGIYWGECAEYCGYQHANMRLVVVAEPAEQFKTWLDAQRHNAAEPNDPLVSRGRDAFLRSACVLCHTINGTQSRGRVGPDLTHVGSRQILAGGAITNTPGNLAGWIVDPQRIKPGTQLPQNNLPPDDLKAIVAYLETLK